MRTSTFNNRPGRDSSTKAARYESKPPTQSELASAADGYWLALAEQCHRSSTDFLDQNIRQQWEKNLAHFNNEHAKDSRFHNPNYKGRNRVFRPKTRSISTRAEAQLSRAMFSTTQVMAVKPRNEADQMQRLGAEVMQNIMQYRLTTAYDKGGIPWFLTAQGAYQDTFNYGICISYQYWKFEFREERHDTGALDQNGGASMRKVYRILKDQPCIDLIEPENFRFDASADWRDVCATSPFLERIMPIYLSEVEERMEAIDPKTNRPKWRPYTRTEIMAASKGWNEEETVRQAREGQGRKDPHDKAQSPREFDIVYCREYIIKQGGIDWVFWTIGHNLLLTDPVPLKDVYFHNRRPFRVGFSTIEAHKAIPASKNQQVSPLQEAINKLTNQRFDNVDLVLNKRYFMRRGQNIDTVALARNTPGGGVYMDDPELDVKVVSTPDVTNSSYEEHNRLAVEMDELAGNFSMSSIQSNRELNETVGGMQLNRGSSDEITEYSILIFIITWVEPVLEQLMLLEQAYESDQVVMKLAADKSQMFKKLNMQGDIPMEVLNQTLEMSVDVGIGNTDPMVRGQQFLMAIKTAVEVVPGAAQRLNTDEALAEIFGTVGRRDASRFFKPEEEAGQQMTPEAMELKRKNDLEQSKQEQAGILAIMKLDQEDEQFYAQLAAEQKMKLDELYIMLGRDREKAKADLARTYMIETNKKNELLLAQRTGSGI